MISPFQPPAASFISEAGLMIEMVPLQSDKIPRCVSFASVRFTISSDKPEDGVGARRVLLFEYRIFGLI